MGAAGPAILFMMLFAASIIVGVFVLAYAARCVLVVVEETALGQDEPTWSNEPYLDWLGHAVLFVELLGIWVAPAALTARLLRHTWLPGEGALRVLLLAGPVLWLFFPIGLLSSLSAQSRWVPLRWAIIRCFLRLAPAALIFYFLTAGLLGGAVTLWYLALFGGRGVLLPVAAIVGAAVLFIYARLLGRVAWLIQRLPSTERTRAPARAKTEKRPSPKPRKKKKRKSIAEVQDPWAVPEEEKPRAKAKRFPWAEEPPKAKPPYAPPSAEEIEGYGIAADKPAAPRPPPKKPARSPLHTPPEEYKPIDVRETVNPGPPAPREPQSELFAEQVRQHIAERLHAEPTPPPHPFFSGVYTFPLYSRCLPNWLALSLAFLVLGGLVSQLFDFGRTLFGW
jgi:hypothetical protein